MYSTDGSTRHCDDAMLLACNKTIRDKGNPTGRLGDTHTRNSWRLQRWNGTLQGWNIFIKCFVPMPMLIATIRWNGITLSTTGYVK